MNDDIFSNLKELAQKLLQEKVTPEAALRSFVNAGILDESGNYTEPYKLLDAYNRQ